VKYYCGIDLHSNNCYLCIMDEYGKVVLQRRVPNRLDVIVAILKPYGESMAGVVVESTYNWYWLIDGLKEAGHTVHLANTVRNKQYSGLKHADDKSDARWLAEMLRLELLYTGYIYPAKERPLRDLLRKRMRMVQMRTMQTLTIQGMVARHNGVSVNSYSLKQAGEEYLERTFKEELVYLSAKSNWAVMNCLEEQIKILEKKIEPLIKLRPEYQQLLTVPGIGKILAMTISLETGEIERFPKVENYASYCRCVPSEHTSNGKKKGKGNTKNGNGYLAWAYIEAATFAIRFHEEVTKFHQRKNRKSAHPLVAKKAVAHKLSRASYYVIKNREPFEMGKAFACTVKRGKEPLGRDNEQGKGKSSSEAPIAS